MNRTLHIVAAALLAFNGVAAAAGKLGVGDPMPTLELKDSSGEKQVLTVAVRRIYASADRAGDKILDKALKKDGQAKLDGQSAIVLADISDVPFFIKGMVRSDLEERSYRTWLDEDEVTRKFLPYREDRVTVVDLDGGRVTALRFVATIEDLREELAPVAKSSPARDADESGAPPEPTPAADETPAAQGAN